MATTMDRDRDMDSQLPTEINVVSLNCWGLKFISKLRNERLAEIGRRLAAADPAPQIVGLQECWCQDDYLAIRRQTAHILPHGKFYYAGAFGAGLAILSRWPIEESTMFRYPLNGRPTAFWRGDWFVGKGVAVAKIRYGPGPEHVVEVFNTHTHAPYEEGRRVDTYFCHRLAQSWEFAKLMRAAASARGHLAVGLGDFNTPPALLTYRLLVAGAPGDPATARDAWRVLHPDSSLGAYAHHAAERARGRPLPTAHYNLVENGATSDSAYNTWRWSRARQRQLGRPRTAAAGVSSRHEVAPEDPCPNGKRLDHVFVAGDTASWAVADARVGMVEPHPTLECSVSDHFSMEVRLVATRPPTSSHNNNNNRQGPTTTSASAGSGSAGGAAIKTPEEEEEELVHRGTYLKSPEGSLHSRGGDGASSYTARQGQGQGQQQHEVRLEGELTADEYDTILEEIRWYAEREVRQRRWRRIHFFAWVAALLASLVGVWWSPHNYVAFILLLVCSLGLVAGTIDGLISLLFIGSEMRALQEFAWEVSNARAALTGEQHFEEGTREKGW
ncbi:uncharacterized protein E0L32_001058 [Thyridium curvatum]|uniref:Endonuclease/exonuclease/phosphatase domain-containing protein n=1 Tax=Thyridium curvatum TaxID=1093900 RepID=A0A507B3R0_9PEZI|nr:uncharacterized protein E0L32_001058 [Thyridium curvatum]TPX11240.1 hypothetical protein E0L32_001058 [Thyridium curvatum]